MPISAVTTVPHCSAASRWQGLGAWKATVTCALSLIHISFPRMLRKLVREEGVLSFEQAVYKRTAMPAQRAHLSGRGVLRPGAAADLLVFRPEDFTDTATYALSLIHI